MPKTSSSNDTNKDTVDARPPRPSPVQVIVVAAPILGFGVLGWIHRAITDDGFIYLRVVRQIEAGNGPVFNAGERVEVFTGPLWLALLWIGDILAPVDLGYVAVGLGVLLSMLGLVFSARSAALISRQTNPGLFLLHVGLLVEVALVPMWHFQTAGLETGLVFAWLGSCLWCLVAWATEPEKPISFGRAALLGLGWLIRPELAIYSGIFLLTLLLLRRHEDGWRHRLRLVGAMAAAPFVYQVFRMGYFGNIVANPAIAKEASSTRPDLGWSYLMDFARPYWLAFPLAILVLGAYLPLLLELGAARRTVLRAVIVSFALASIVNVGYIVLVGGDYFHARLLLPALFAVCAPVALLPASRTYVGALLVAPWALICGLALRPPQLGGQPVEGRDARWVFPNHPGLVTTADWGWGPDQANREWYDGPGLYHSTSVFEFGFRRMDVEPAAGVRLPTAVLLAVGIPSYAMAPELQVLDVLGLGDPLTARLELTRRGYLPGHEKNLPAPWILARLVDEAEPIDSTSLPADLADQIGSHLMIPEAEGTELEEQVRWAREALQCGEIAQLQRSVSEPLTVGRFLSNIVHSFEQTSLRVPADPEAAYHRFCEPE